MSPFRKKKDDTPPPPVRRDKVIAMIKADLDREDAIDREDNEAWRRAQAAGNTAWQGATKAEIQAANEGVKRATDTRWFK